MAISASNPDEAGACIVVGGPLWSRSEIELYANYWDYANDHERAAVLQHERGHCMYTLTHSYAPLLDDGCEASIMSPTLPSSDCLYLHARFYQDDMAVRTEGRFSNEYDLNNEARSEPNDDESVASMF